jgi:hypothetical protein
MRIDLFASLGRALNVRQTLKEMDVMAEFEATEFGLVQAQLYQVGGGRNGMG